MDKQEKDNEDKDALIAEVLSRPDSTPVKKKKKRRKKRPQNEGDEDSGVSNRDRKTSSRRKTSGNRTSRSGSEKDRSRRRRPREEGDGIHTFPYDTPLTRDDVEVGNHLKLNVDSNISTSDVAAPTLGRELRHTYKPQSTISKSFEVDPYFESDHFEIFSTENRCDNLLGILKQRRFRMICLILVVLLFILVLVGASKSKSTPSEQSQSGNEQAQFTSQLMSLLSEKSRNAHLLADSPQTTALAWLVNQSKFESYSYKRLVQRYALATIYYSMSGDSWKKNDLWLTEADECNWYPQNDEKFNNCDDDKNLKFLTLSANDLYGSLPDEISLLTALDTIDLSRNDLEGTLSSYIGTLSKISSLNLERNNFTGSIPISLTNLPQIQNLILSSNDFEGEGPLATDLAAWSNLVEISLDSNSLVTGQISKSIKTLSKLRSFLIGNTSINGSIPSEIFSLSNLKYFEAANALLDGQIPTEIGRSTDLLVVRLSRNKLTGLLPSEIGLLPNLEFLTLSENQLSGQIPSELGLLKNILEIKFEDNKFNGIIPSQIGQLTTIAALHVASNSFTQQSLPSEICGLTTSHDLPTSDLRVTCTVVSCDCCSGEDGTKCVAASEAIDHHRHPDDTNCTEPDIFGC
mmetsp:Transcript_29510/g.45012  ORF Transcript_29510/g.45012 Transcript_29510/m.45012 type:complete len:632 (+) Transcript_29510:2-1897(+)